MIKATAINEDFSNTASDVLTDQSLAIRKPFWESLLTDVDFNIDTTSIALLSLVKCIETVLFKERKVYLKEYACLSCLDVLFGGFVDYPYL